MHQVERLGSRRERKPRERLVESVNMAIDECNVVESLTQNLNEPNSLDAALNGHDSVKWGDALQSEYNSLNYVEEAVTKKMCTHTIPVKDISNISSVSML